MMRQKWDLFGRSFKIISSSIFYKIIQTEMYFNCQDAIHLTNNPHLRVMNGTKQGAERVVAVKFFKIPLDAFPS